MLGLQDKLELKRLIKERNRLSQLKAARTPRSSYICESHDGPYLDAVRQLHTIDDEISKILIPTIDKYRRLGLTWENIKVKLNISHTVLKMVRNSNTTFK